MIDLDLTIVNIKWRVYVLSSLIITESYRYFSESCSDQMMSSPSGGDSGYEEYENLFEDFIDDSSCEVQDTSEDANTSSEASISSDLDWSREITLDLTRDITPIPEEPSPSIDDQSETLGSGKRNRVREECGTCVKRKQLEPFCCRDIMIECCLAYQKGTCGHLLKCTEQCEIDREC